MDVLVLAGGGFSKANPIYPLAGDQPKSMVPIAGKPMAQWVLDALSGAELIDSVAVIGLDESCGLHCGKALSFLPDTDSLLQNIQRGAAYFLQANPADSHMLTVSADIPAVTAEIIDTCIRLFSAREFDVYYSVVENTTMENRYPGSRRTYVKLQDGQVCGGDVNCIRKQAALDPDSAWSGLIRNRKNPIKQASMIGWGTLLMLIAGRLTLDEAASRVCHRLGIKGKAVKMPFPEIGMDVDKPFQHSIVERDLLR